MKTITQEDVRQVSPALVRYGEDLLLGDLWRRPQLGPRDRSIVTVTALIARSQAIELPRHFGLALDHGVTHGELSEIVTHLSFYSGWANGTGAVAVLQEVFARRGIKQEQLPAAWPELLPVDEKAEASRAKTMDETMGPKFQGLVDYTRLLFNDLWLRPGLKPRDRSLVTVSALVTGGQVGLLDFHLYRAMDNGISEDQAAEVITHLAFYAGLPNAMAAVPVAKQVFKARSA